MTRPAGNYSTIPLNCFDDEFFQSIAHVDDAIIKKIELGKFIELERLVPKTKVTLGLDNRLESINKDGYSYLVPASDKEIQAINSYKKWEVAFRVYGNIFTRANLSHTTEIYQYMDAIYTAASNYVWENVYMYDFFLHRKLMDKQPLRS